MPRKFVSLDELIAAGYQFPQIESEDEILDRIEYTFILERLRIALLEIPEPDRTIFILHADGNTQRRIAELTYRNQQYVSRSIKRARAKLLYLLKNV